MLKEIRERLLMIDFVTYLLPHFDLSPNDTLMPSVNYTSNDKRRVGTIGSNLCTFVFILLMKT